MKLTYLQKHQPRSLSRRKMNISSGPQIAYTTYHDIQRMNLNVCYRNSHCQEIEAPWKHATLEQTYTKMWVSHRLWDHYKRTKKDSARNKPAKVLGQTLQCCGHAEQEHAGRHCNIMSLRFRRDGHTDVHHTWGLNRFIQAFEGISNNTYGTKLAVRRQQTSGP